MIRLGPLGVPDPGEADATALARSPAVQLYLTHARAADHRFDPDRRGLQTIAEVCRRLDGLPGAIELAAARVTLLPPSTLLARLDRAPLAAGLRRSDPGAPPRPTAFGTAISSIHETLDDAAATVLRRLAVLHGPVPLDGVEQIAADPDWTPDRLLDAITDLIDSHLLDASGEPEPRFHLPASVAAFARERLELADERDLASDRRNAWCLTSMADRGLRLDAPPTPAAMEDLLASQEDLLARGDVEGALRLSIDCGPTWSHTAWPPSAERTMERAIAQAVRREGAAVHPGTLLRARIWYAYLMTERADPRPPSEIAASFRALVDEARGIDDPRLSLLAHAALALALPWTLDFEAAVASVQAGLQLSPAVGDPFWTTRYLYWSGMMATRFHDYRTATELGGHGMAAALAAGDQVAMIPAGILLHSMAAMGEVIPPSTPSPEQLLETARLIGSQIAESWVLSLMAHDAVERGDLDSAVDRSVELLWVGQRIGTATPLTLGIAALAGAAAERGDLPVAARFAGMVTKDMALLMAVALAERAASFQARLQRARERLGADVWDRHAAAGALLSPVAAVHEALTWATSVAASSGPAELTRVRPAPAVAPSVEPLTPREEQVLRHIARGDSNKDIAHALAMSPKTVMHHSMSIYRKLGVRGRSEATAWAYRHGMVTGSRPD